MNFRDIQGFESPRALYEFVSINHKLHAASMDDLIRCVAEIQRRALASRNTLDAAIDRALDAIPEDAKIDNYLTREEN